MRQLKVKPWLLPEFWKTHNFLHLGVMTWLLLLTTSHWSKYLAIDRWKNLPPQAAHISMAFQNNISSRKIYSSLWCCITSPSCINTISGSQEWLMDTSIDHLNVITTDCDNMENDIIAANNASLERIKAVTWSRVKEASISGKYLKDIKFLILAKFPASSSDLPAQLQPYWKYRNDISIIDDVILIGSLILKTPSLYGEICKILHSDHQGTSASKGNSFLVRDIYLHQ